jgi:hypothetical protein
MSADRVAAMLGERCDLLTIDTTSSRPWTPGARRITRPGLRTTRFGARGSGKSWAELILAVQVCEAGGSVLYADWENGPRRQAERLAAILADRPSATRAAVAERLDYRPNPRLGKLGSASAVEEWAALFTGRDLAVIDSCARALAQLGLDENQAADFARFMVSYIDPIAAQNVAVDLLDNTGWSESDRTRGSSAKLDLVECAHRVTSTDIAPDKAGTITLDRVRSRDGDEALQLVVNVGAGSYSDVHQPDLHERDAALAEMLLEYIAEHPGEPTEPIAKALHLRPSRVRDGLSKMEDAGTACRCPSRVTDGRGRVRNRTGWYLASQSQTTAVPDHGTGTDGNNSERQAVPPSHPFKGGDGDSAGPENGHVGSFTDRLLADFT